MAEPFKNFFNEDLVRGMAGHFCAVAPKFEGDAFVADALEGFEALELKQRSNQIKDALIRHLPEDFEAAAEILHLSLAKQEFAELSDMQIVPSGIAGWAVMPMADFVEAQGREHFDLSMLLLKEMTKRSSSEFAIRGFLRDEPERTLEVISDWVGDDSFHVRRLASEGSRPRLPWGLRLQKFVDDPTPLVPILEALKDDPEEYVRRSVANNLNDISKDHPARVVKIAKRWLKNATPDRTRLVRHACRSLIKAGDAGVMEAFGYGEPQLAHVDLNIKTALVRLGGHLEFDLALLLKGTASQKLVIDYAVHHMKANGTTSPKMFKWKDLAIAGPGISGEPFLASRKHPMRKITTRVYYPGTHRLEIFANGVSIANGEFQFEM